MNNPVKVCMQSLNLILSTLLLFAGLPAKSIASVKGVICASIHVPNRMRKGMKVTVDLQKMIDWTEDDDKNKISCFNSVQSCQMLYPTIMV